MNPHRSEVARVVPDAISAPPAFSLRRLLAAAVGLLLIGTVARATPTISITSPTSGSTIASVTTPAGFTISATATATSGASIASVQFFDNGTSIGTVGGTSPFSITWIPTTSGQHTLTATVTDNSVPTTGTSPSLNTATATSIVSVTTVRTVTVLAPTSGATLAQNSAIFLRSIPTLSDTVVANVRFRVDGTNVGPVITASPFNTALVLSAANGFTVGAHNLTAVATNGDGSITATSAAVPINIAAAVGTAPTVSLTTSASGGVTTVNQNVTLSATASDADGFIPSTSGVTFFVDGDPVVPVGTGETNPKLVSPYTLTWRPTVAKTYSLQALTVDDRNNYVLSSVVTVTAGTATLPPSVTLTSPASGTTLTVGTAVSLAATATANGGATVTKVDFLSGTTVLGTATTAPYTFSWTPSTAGTFSITARVTDSNSNVATSSAASVTVATSAPTISISAPNNGATVALGTSTTVTANAAANGGATVSRVDFFSGSTAIGTALTSPFSIAWTPTTSGINALTARVTDSNATVVTSAIVNVNVTAPTITLTSPASGATVTVGVPVALGVTASAISPATITKVDFYAGNVLVDTETAAPYLGSWTPSAAGTVALTARVTDSNGAVVTSASVTVTAAAAAGPTVALTTPQVGAVVTIGSNVTLSATATPGSGATVAQVQFLVGTTVVGTVTATPYTVTWVPSATGNQTLTARVIDSSNATVTSSAVTVTAVAATAVAITSPSSGSTATVGTAVNVTASATASAGASITQVAFFANGVAIGSPVTAAPYTIAWTPSVSGTTSLTARATDSLGVTVTAAAVNVTVSPAAPTIALTTPQIGAVLTIGSNVTLAASATPGSGATIAQVQFLVGTTVVGTVTAAPYTVVWNPTTAGNFTLTARVTDSTNTAVTSSSVSVTVVAATTVTLTAPANNATASTGVAVPLTATATPSAGATITQVAFFANNIAVGSAITASPYTVNWTPTAAGTYLLTARATDSFGNTVTSSAASVAVTDPAAPTIALALSPGTAPATTLPSGATRYALATVTPAPGRAVVVVEFFIDGVKVGERTAAPYVYRYTAPATPGNYVLLARVTDNAGLTRDTQVTLTVATAVGQPPTVALISPANNATAVPGTAVSLAATALGVGGSVTGVQFYANGAPIGNPVASSPYTGSFTPTAPGTYAIQAIATDDRGNTTVSNTATITAAFTAPVVNVVAPTGTAVAPTRATPGVPFTLSATATPGSSATVLLVEFFVGGNFVGSRTAPTVANGSTYSFVWTPTTAQLGVAQVTARVTDTNSLSTTSNPTYVNVATVTTPPPVITGVAVNPVPAVGVQTLSTANFVATVAPGNTSLTVATVEFFLTDGVTPFKIGNGTRETTTGNLYRLVYGLDTFDYTAVTPNANNAYPLQLFVIARDNTGVQTQSALVNVTINPSSSAPPTIQTAALGGTTIAQGNTFQLAAQPADSDGNIASIQLYANGVTSGAAQLNPVNGGVALFNFTPTAAGTYRLFVAVTDDTGNTNISGVTTLTVTATAAPVVTLNRPSDNTTVTTVGAPTYLDATVTLADQTLTPTVQFTVSGSGGRTVPSITATRVGTTTTYRGIFTNATADTYTIGLTASVAGGTVSTTSTTTRTVQLVNAVGNVPLVSAITTLGSAQTASTVTFQTTATDGDGSVDSVEFFLNRNSIGFAERQQLTNVWRITASFAGLTAGTYEVQAIARDNSGNAAATAVVNLGVTTSTSAPPLVRITATPLTVAFNQTAVLNATATDADGTVTQVQYYSNGTLLATSTAGPLFAANFPGTTSGSYTVFAIATDNTGNTAVSPNLTLKVLPNNPLIDDTAFILQTSTDLSNATPNAVQLAAFQAQFAAGTLTRSQFAAAIATNNGAFNNTNFNNIANALSAYWLLMGQWPTSANYTTIFNARGSLANVCNAIITSPEYLIKYGATPTAALLDNPNGVLPAATFLARLRAAAGLPGPSQLDVLRFMSNDTSNATLGIGRGYQVVGLPTAIAEFITFNNSGNTALINLGRTAALYYQLDRPTVLTPQDAALTTNTVSTPAQVAARIATLAPLPDLTAIAAAALADNLYSYRYVTITKQPQPLAVAARSGAIFSVAALGAPPISYQWLQNGAPISGATASTLYLTNVGTAQAGNYSVVVTTSAGSATSDPALLAISAAPTRLGNISSRGVAGVGANVLTAGFVVTGTGTKQMLIRVVGPSLAGLGISGFLPNPNLTVVNSAGVAVQTNDNWGTQTGGAAAVTAIQQATARVGAFALPANSLDAVVLATLNPGGYTVQAAGAGVTTGVAIIEVYDASAALTGPKAVNVSTRANVGTGENILIAGFVVNGTVSRRVLIRGIGPTLRNFGLPPNGVLADPQLKLLDAAGSTVATNDDWSAGPEAPFISAAAAAAGAFPLGTGSKDASLLVMLAPGAYTAQLSGVGTTNNTGIGLIEVYDVDP